MFEAVELKRLFDKNGPNKPKRKMNMGKRTCLLIVCRFSRCYIRVHLACYVARNTKKLGTVFMRYYYFNTFHFLPLWQGSAYTFFETIVYNYEDVTL